MEEQQELKHADIVKLEEEIKQEQERAEKEEKEEYERLEQSPLFRKVSLGYLDLNKRHNELIAALNDKKFLKNRLRIVSNKR